MARQVIVLDKVAEDGESITFRYAFWLAVPTARRALWAASPPPGFSQTSQLVGTEAPTAGELSSFSSGAVTEFVGTASFPKRNQSTGQPLTGAQIIARAKADLQTGYAAKQAEVDGTNPWSRYGTVWDGSAWTDKTVS